MRCYLLRQVLGRHAENSGSSAVAALVGAVQADCGAPVPQIKGSSW